MSLLLNKVKYFMVTSYKYTHKYRNCYHLCFPLGWVSLFSFFSLFCLSLLNEWKIDAVFVLLADRVWLPRSRAQFSIFSNINSIFPGREATITALLGALIKRMSALQMEIYRIFHYLRHLRVPLYHRELASVTGKSFVLGYRYSWFS